MMKIDQEKFLAALRLKKVSDKEIEKLVEAAESTGIPIQEVASSKHVLSDESMGKLIAEVTGFPYVDLSKVEIASEILEIMPENIALKQGVITFQIDDNTQKVKVATTDPFDLEMLNDIEKKTGRELEVFYTTQQNIKNIIGKYHQELKHIFLSMLPEHLRFDIGTNQKAAVPEGDEIEDEIPIGQIFDSNMLPRYRQLVAFVVASPI